MPFPHRLTLPRSFLTDHWFFDVLTYSETLDYLFALHRFGVKLGLDPIVSLLERLNQPQRHYPTLHIGGTNGKGSSAAMVAAMLQAGGYRVGLYTSPHLLDFRERIRVQGEEISEEQVCTLTAHVRQTAESLGSLTFFEFTTALAFLCFREQRVDIAVIEVGLGGRYDATNVLDPLGVLITGIGFDHEAHLGSTLPDIAREKAGIIHSSKPVVLGRMPDLVQSVFDSIVQQQESPMYCYGRHFSISPINHTIFSYHGLRGTISGLQTNLLGAHQMRNAACALALLEASAHEQFPLSVESIREGLLHVHWKGRLQIVQHDPLVILDGAHNPSGARVLFDFLQLQLHDCPDRKIIVVLGMMQDKNHAEYLHVLLPVVDTLILTQPHMVQAALADALQQTVSLKTVKTMVIREPGEAYRQAHHVACPNDVICVTGSLFLVGDILKQLPQHPSLKCENEEG